MMRLLLVAEIDRGRVRKNTLSAIRFGQEAVSALGGTLVILAIGHNLTEACSQLAHYAPVLAADDPILSDPVADKYAQLIVQCMHDRHCDYLAAPAGTFAKDVVTRAAARLGGAMAGDIIGFVVQDGTLTYRRALYAGRINAEVELNGTPQIVTVQATAFEPAEPSEMIFPITPLAFDPQQLPDTIEVLGLDRSGSARPDVTEAKVVVSGGRAIRSKEDFERLIGALADRLHGAAGSSRALVDAGIAPNELQVGQTGKVVAPALYLALGISGAVQHLAGMKNAKTIAAINNDPDAPIFEVADYGLVADVYQAVPELIEKLPVK